MMKEEILPTSGLHLFLKITCYNREKYRRINNQINEPMEGNIGLKIVVLPHQIPGSAICPWKLI
jgi:hypothetical protein